MEFFRGSQYHSVMSLTGVDPMKLLRALGVVVGLVAFPLMVFADDWSGFYGGGSLGGRVANSDWKTDVCCRY